jgi:hypothetical protein
MSGGIILAQTEKTPKITDNTTTVLTKYGWQDKIKFISVFADGHALWAQFISADAEASVLNALRQNKNFKSSNGIMLKLFHRGAKKSFRESKNPSLHIVFYENIIEIHFDLHFPALKHPLESYEHFREVFMNFWHHSATSQAKVARALKKQSLHNCAHF